MERHKLFGRPITLHPDLLVEFFQQLRQCAYYTPLLVHGLSLLLVEERPPGVFRRAYAEIGKTQAFFAGPDQCDNRTQPFGDFSLRSDPLIRIGIGKLLGANGLEERFLTLQDFGYLFMGLHKRIARAGLKCRHHLFEARDDTALRFGCFGETSGL